VLASSVDPFAFQGVVVSPSMMGVERGLERSTFWFVRLFSRPLRWMTGLSHVELMNPAMWEA